MSEAPEGSRTPPPRVRVTGPPRRRAGEIRSAAGEIDAESELGEVFMRSLLREQARLSGAVLAAVALTFGAVPIAFHLAPGLTRVEAWGVPLAWLLLGGVGYVWLVFLGWLYIRRAEANEADFAALVSEMDDPS